MKKRYQFTACAIAAGALVGSLATAQAELPVSREAAIAGVEVAGSGAVTPVSVPFTQTPILRDTVASTSGSTITGVTGSYPASLAGTHIVLIVTGSARGKGLDITANTATTVTVAGSLPTLVANVDQFEIVPLPTLNSVFGGVATGGPFDLAGSSSAGSADLVSIGSTRYFYKTSGVNAPGWKTDSAPNAAPDLGNTVIPNLRGVNVLRRSTTKTIGVRGTNRLTRSVLPIPNGATLLSWPFPKNVSLINSGLQNSITGASSAGAADKVIVSGTRYFYKTSGVQAPGWKLESLPNEALPARNNVILNGGGKAFVIVRGGTATEHATDEVYAE